MTSNINKTNVNKNKNDDPNPIEHYAYIQEGKNNIIKHIYFFIILGLELWAENRKGKNDPKQEPYFKVRNNYKNFI